MPSSDAVIVHYSLGAALSCDALRWKHAVGIETLGRCFLHCRAVLGEIEESAILGVVVVWARNIKRDLCGL